MMKLLTLEQIKAALPSIDLMEAIEAGFVAYSEGRAVVPPVGELIMAQPPGDVHIKYGYIRGDEYYVIKVASGFYDNPKLNLPSSNGLMLLFSQKTGELRSVLLDEGHLTDIRTAVAGAIAAKYLAPSVVLRIGIVGTGIQARLQLQYLSDVTSCREVMVWGRSEEKLAAYQADMAPLGFTIESTLNTPDILATCNLIVTTTPATAPLLKAAGKLPHGLHITAVGADTAHKQELDPAILQQADLVVADSIPQCLERGEIYQAIKAGTIKQDTLLELGRVILGKNPSRSSDNQITVADLTGVAVQDIQIAKAVYEMAG
ncbi:MAG: ornithine cyclodeaminase family protein [Ardenticatenaceae bacterium]